jgi:hypothetical protein
MMCPGQKAMSRELSESKNNRSFQAEFILPRYEVKAGFFPTKIVKK